MSEESARVMMNIWYLFVLGGVRCWAELRFVARLSGKKVKPIIYLLYLIASRIPAALCVWIQAPHYGNLILLALLFFFSVKLLRLSPGNAVLASTIVFVINTFFEGFLDVLMNPIASTIHAPSLLASIVIQMLVSSLILAGSLVAFFFISHTYPIKEGADSPSSMFTLLPCALIIWAVRLVIEPTESGIVRSQAETNLVMLVWMAVSVIAFFSILAANHKSAQLIIAYQEKCLLEREYRIQSQNARESVRRWNDTRAYQHDVRNHFLVVSGLLKRDMYEDATTYLEALVASADELVPRVSTENPALDILLEEKIQFAQREGISVIVDLPFPSLENMREIDICVLFANALDNAINACLTMPSDQKHIWIAVKKRHDFLMIQIENDTKEDSSQVIYGIGLHNIRRIALKHGGSMQTERQGNTFRLSVLLCYPTRK